MVITGKRNDLKIRYKAGADAEGRLIAVDFTHLVRCGYSQDLSLAVADRAMLHADNCYWIPNIRIESHRLKTHTQSATAYRGFGGPPGIVGIERVIDHLAHHLGLDPLTIMQRNLYAAMGSTHQTTPYGMEVDDSITDQILDRLIATSDYPARRKAVEAFNAKSPILKKGLALTPVKSGIPFTASFLNQAGALIHIYPDQHHIAIPTDLITGKPRTDLLFPEIAFHHLSLIPSV
eukprot:gene1939-2550_t